MGWWARGQSVGTPADGALGIHAGATTVICCDVNKPVRPSLHSEKVKILTSDCGFFLITQNKGNRTIADLRYGGKDIIRPSTLMFAPIKS